MLIFSSLFFIFWLMGNTRKETKELNTAQDNAWPHQPQKGQFQQKQSYMQIKLGIWKNDNPCGWLNLCFVVITYWILHFFFKKKSPNRKVLKKKPKAQLAQTPGPKTETDRKTDQNRNKLKPTVFQLFRSVSVETFTNRKFRFRLAG